MSSGSHVGKIQNGRYIPRVVSGMVVLQYCHCNEGVPFCGMGGKQSQDLYPSLDEIFIVSATRKQKDVHGVWRDSNIQ